MEDSLNLGDPKLDC